MNADGNVYDDNIRKHSVDKVIGNGVEVEDEERRYPATHTENANETNASETDMSEVNKDGRNGKHIESKTTKVVKDDVDEMKDEGIEIRLGDLDHKTPRGGKAMYWRAVEEELIDGGWYTATEPPPSQRLDSGGGTDEVIGDGIDGEGADPCLLHDGHRQLRWCHDLLAVDERKDGKR